MPHTLSRSLNILAIFGCNMSSTGVILIGNLVRLYLQNGHAKLATHEDFISRFRLWYAELAPISVKQCTFVSTGNTSLTARPLCTGLISTWLSPVGTKYRWTVPFGFGIVTKLLHHSAVSSTPGV